MAQVCNWNRLPVEIQNMVFDNLNFKERVDCELVCKQWCYLLSHKPYQFSEDKDPAFKFVTKALANSREISKRVHKKLANATSDHVVNNYYNYWGVRFLERFSQLKTIEIVAYNRPVVHQTEIYEVPVRAQEFLACVRKTGTLEFKNFFRSVKCLHLATCVPNWLQSVHEVDPLNDGYSLEHLIEVLSRCFESITELHITGDVLEDEIDIMDIVVAFKHIEFISIALEHAIVSISPTGTIKELPPISHCELVLDEDFEILRHFAQLFSSSITMLKITMLKITMLKIFHSTPQQHPNRLIQHICRFERLRELDMNVHDPELNFTPLFDACRLLVFIRLSIFRFEDTELSPTWPNILNFLAHCFDDMHSIQQCKITEACGMPSQTKPTVGQCMARRRKEFETLIGFADFRLVFDENDDKISQKPALGVFQYKLVRRPENF